MPPTPGPQSESLSERYGQPIALVVVFAVLTGLIGVRSIVRGLRRIVLLPRKEMFPLEG